MIFLMRNQQLIHFNFPEKTFPEKNFSFSGPKVGACHKCPKGPGPNKKKEKIGTIFWEQTFRFVTPKGPFKFREALRSATFNLVVFPAHN
jgi:hypothetical protein